MPTCSRRVVRLLVVAVLALAACGGGEDATTSDSASTTEDLVTTSTDPETTTTTEPATTTTTEPPGETISWTQSNESDEYPLTVRFTAHLTAPCSVEQESATTWNIDVSLCLSVSAEVTEAPFGAGGLASQGGIPLPSLVIVSSLEGADPGDQPNCSMTACARYPLDVVVPDDPTCPDARPTWVCTGSMWDHPPAVVQVPAGGRPALALMQYERANNVVRIGQVVDAGETGRTVTANDALSAICDAESVSCG